VPNEVLLELCRIDDGLPEKIPPGRADLAAWCMEALSSTGKTLAAHHRLLVRELQDAIQGRTPRLMINLPPGSAKTTYGTILSAAWAFAQRPGLDVICASNTAQMAEGFSRRTQALIRDHPETLGYSLTREAAEEWTTSNGGHYRAAGVGAAIAGTRADLVIIDDPTRSRADAESAVVRESQWAWFVGDLRTRLKPEATIIVIMTRWHPDDLGGRLLDRQKGLWRVISIPAIAEENDPLGRAPGEWLWDDDPSYRYGEELRKAYAEYQEAGAMRDWQALYQQSPRTAEGSLFKIGKIDVLEVAPDLRGALVGRGWDLAATKQLGIRDPDWTVGVKLARMPTGGYVVLDVLRFRGGPDEVETAIRNVAKQDGVAVRQSLPQDPGQAGKAQALAFVKMLAGYQVETSPETGDKATRASLFASQVNGGNVAIVRAPWNAAFLDELAAFPNGIKDDQVDAASRAFALVGLKSRPMIISDRLLERIEAGHSW
jgi:predicted phage terminase large subunit-like protein